MIELPLRVVESLIYVEPTYVLVEGTDLRLAFDFDEEWGGKEIAALFRHGEQIEEVPVEGGACIVPRFAMAIPKFNLTVIGHAEGERSINTQTLPIYVGPTIKPTEGGENGGAGN